MEAPELREAYRDATLRRDPEAVVELLAEDVTFRSPVVPFPFVGRAAVADVFRAAYGAFGEMELLAEAGGATGPQVLRFASSMRGRPLQTAVFIDADGGRIREVAVFVRPFAGAAAVAAALAGPLARGPLQRVALTLLAVPLAALIGRAEPMIHRLVRTR